MVKITIEMSEEYVNGKANPDNLLVNIPEGKNKSLLRVMNTIAFGVLANKVKAGQTEFTITQSKLDEEEQQLFDNDISSFCILAIKNNDEQTDEE